MTIGVILLGIAVSMLVMTDFGTDPFSSLCLGFSARTGIPYGVCQMSGNLALMLAVVLFGRSFIGVGTFFNMILIGYIADLWTMLLKWLMPSYAALSLSLAARLLWLIPSLAVFLCGAVLYMTASAGVAPYDAIPMMLSLRLRRIPFRFIRITWDALFSALSFCIGGPIGAVTVLIILTVGPAVTYLGRIVGKRFYGTPSIE